MKFNKKSKKSGVRKKNFQCFGMSVRKTCITTLFAGDFACIAGIKMTLSTVSFEDFAIFCHAQAFCERLVGLAFHKKRLVKSVPSVSGVWIYVKRYRATIMVSRDPCLLNGCSTRKGKSFFRTSTNLRIIS